MGKVTSTQVPSQASPPKGRSKAGDGNPMAPTAQVQRGTRASTVPAKTQSPKPKINIGAATLVQQLTEVNRRLGSGTTDPNSIAPLQSRRDAILGELEQNYSVHVVHRSDGTIRIRTEEGRVLLDSTEVADTQAPMPTLGDSGASPSNPQVSTSDAVALYQKMDLGENAIGKVGLSSPEPQPSIGSLAPVSSVETVQRRIEIVDRLEMSLQESQHSLRQASELSGNVRALISQQPH